MSNNIFNEFDFKRNTGYWNDYYAKNVALQTPSPFAKFVYSNYLNAGKDLLELGCGNGRDSLYFVSKGINVTAIDASDVAINALATKGGGWKHPILLRRFC